MKKHSRGTLQLLRQLQLYITFLLLQLCSHTRLKEQKESKTTVKKYHINLNYKNEEVTPEKADPNRIIASDPDNAAETKQFIKITPELHTKNAKNLYAQALLGPKLSVDTIIKPHSLASKYLSNCFSINQDHNVSTEITEQYKSISQEVHKDITQEPEDILSEEVNEDTIDIDSYVYNTIGHDERTANQNTSSHSYTNLWLAIGEVFIAFLSKINAASKQQPSEEEHFNHHHGIPELLLNPFHTKKLINLAADQNRKATLLIIYKPAVWYSKNNVFSLPKEPNSSIFIFKTDIQHTALDTLTLTISTPTNFLVSYVVHDFTSSYANNLLRARFNYGKTSENFLPVSYPHQSTYTKTISIDSAAGLEEATSLQIYNFNAEYTNHQEQRINILCVEWPGSIDCNILPRNFSSQTTSTDFSSPPVAELLLQCVSATNPAKLEHSISDADYFRNNCQILDYKTYGSPTNSANDFNVAYEIVSNGLVPHYGIQSHKTYQPQHLSPTTVVKYIPQQCVAAEGKNNLLATHYPAILVQPVCPVIYLQPKAEDTGNNLPAELPNYPIVFQGQVFKVHLPKFSKLLPTSIFPNFSRGKITILKNNLPVVYQNYTVQNANEKNDINLDNSVYNVEERETAAGNTCPNPFFFEQKADEEETHETDHQEQNGVINTLPAEIYQSKKIIYVCKPRKITEPKAESTGLLPYISNSSSNLITLIITYSNISLREKLFTITSMPQFWQQQLGRVKDISHIPITNPLHQEKLLLPISTPTNFPVSYVVHDFTSSYAIDSYVDNTIGHDERTASQNTSSWLWPLGGLTAGVGLFAYLLNNAVKKLHVISDYTKQNNIKYLFYFQKVSQPYFFFNHEIGPFFNEITVNYLQISVLQTRFEKIIFATYDGNILTPLFHCTKLSIDFSQTPKFYYFTNNPEHPYYEFLQTSAILEIFPPRVLAPGNIALNIESLPLSLFQTNIIPQQNVGKNILLAIEYFPEVPLPPAEPEPDQPEPVPELPNEPMPVLPVPVLPAEPDQPEPDQPEPVPELPNEPMPVLPVLIPPVLHMYFENFILFYNHRNPEHHSLYKSFLSSYIPGKVHECLNPYQISINKCKKQLNQQKSILNTNNINKFNQLFTDTYQKGRHILTPQKIIELKNFQRQMDFLKTLPYKAYQEHPLQMVCCIFGAEEKGDGYRMILADILTYPNKIPEGYIRLDANNGDGQCFAQAAEMASSLQNASVVIEPIIGGNHYHAVVAAKKNEIYLIIYHVMKATIIHYNTAHTAASMRVTQDISFGTASPFSNQYSISHDYSPNFPQSDTQKSLGIFGSANNDAHFTHLDPTKLIGTVLNSAFTTAKILQLSDKITSYQDADDATKPHHGIDIATSAIKFTTHFAGKSLPGGLVGQTTLTSVPHIGYALWQGDVQTAKAHTKIAVENITEYGLLLGGITAAGMSLPAATLVIPSYQITKTAFGYADINISITKPIDYLCGYFSDWYYAESNLQAIMSRHETSVETQLADNQ